MRNNWSLWGDSGLSKWFKSIGIFHADDMSSIILDSLVRSLKDEPIDLDGQVKFYQDYWKKMKSNPSRVTLENKDGKWFVI